MHCQRKIITAVLTFHIMAMPFILHLYAATLLSTDNTPSGFTPEESLERQESQQNKVDQRNEPLPSASSEPTPAPSSAPSAAPYPAPSAAPSSAPSPAPSAAPSSSPFASPAPVKSAVPLAERLGLPPIQPMTKTSATTISENFKTSTFEKSTLSSENDLEASRNLSVAIATPFIDGSAVPLSPGAHNDSYEKNNGLNLNQETPDLSLNEVPVPEITAEDVALIRNPNKIHALVGISHEPTIGDGLVSKEDRQLEIARENSDWKTLSRIAELGDIVELNGKKYKRVFNDDGSARLVELFDTLSSTTPSKS
jgi:hypothetical protein